MNGSSTWIIPALGAAGTRGLTSFRRGDAGVALQPPPCVSKEGEACLALRRSPKFVGATHASPCNHRRACRKRGGGASPLRTTKASVGATHASPCTHRRAYRKRARHASPLRTAKASVGATHASPCNHRRAC